MMAANNPYTKVRENSIYTATPEELTLMLYDGALKFTNQAIIAIERKDYLKANGHISRVRDIISEFQVTLKPEYEISAQLNSIYNYINRTITTANIKKDVDLLNEVAGLIRELRDTWKEAMKISRSSKK